MNPIHSAAAGEGSDPRGQRSTATPCSSGSITSSLIAVASLLTSATGCLCPPCAASPGTTVAAPITPGVGGSEAPAAAVASGKSEVIWDGDEVSRGQSWAGCDKEGACKATLTAAPGEGAAGTNGMKLHGEGSGWQGGGWNWFGWYPENAGTDLSGYDDLKLSIKVTGAAKDKTPDAGGITFAFGCSKDKKDSAAPSLGKYAANATDGQWHDVTIPLKDFFEGKGAACDPRTAWEFRVSSWSASAVNFDIVVDNLTVAKK